MKRRDFLQAAVMAVVVPRMVGATSSQPTVETTATHIKDQLQMTLLPDIRYADDVLLPASQLALLKMLNLRLQRLQGVVGHGNFALLDVDLMLQYARNYSRIGRFSKPELALLEQLFYTDASEYGFLGEKPMPRLTASIELPRVEQPSGSVQRLFRGEAENTYRAIRKKMGDAVVLTSGVRGLVKQFHLFISKAVEHDGNLSLASRSLAPPGYSFHGVGDFDVGIPGWGARNFTADFAETDEYKRLQDLGFIEIRYPKDNHLGVRYEPWHIKVVKA